MRPQRAGGPVLASLPGMAGGLYAGASAIDAYQRRAEAVMHNLANLETPGFKRVTAALRSFDQALGKAQDGGLGGRGSGGGELKRLPRKLSLGGASRGGGGGRGRPAAPVLLVEATPTIDFSQGDLVSTMNPLDVAIDGPGFFAVQTAQGVRFTRAGVFTRGAQGELVTKDGEPVLGTGGPIALGDAPASELMIDEQGRVSVGGREVGTLRIVDFATPYPLAPEGRGLYRPLPGAQEVEPRGAVIRQGQRERSNAEAVTELMALIEAHRSFEAATRSIESVVRALERTAELR